MLIWKTPPTFSATSACSNVPKLSYTFAKSCNNCMVDLILPLASVLSTPKLSNKFTTLPLCSLVKIVLKELPITAPPRAVVCCAEVTIAISSFNETPDCAALLPTRLIASAKSSELTANAASTLANLLTISVVVAA